ncbi:MAG TPA: erythromycin esterase family protein [Candidatus Binatus sp.]|uniref:erythromycin esterase family protein n=1 Tax=Candidatus Binatus sp. TaxID=2811406 RepID=UPI002F3E6D45
MKVFDSSRRRAIEDFRAYAAERAIEFKDLEAIEENARRLSILDPLLTGKRFAYIGESDHFIHEKYEYRLLMLKYLAGRGFTHLGEEVGASDGMRIDRFIATGDESQLERVTIYGYAGATRSDRDDTPTGILRESFGDAYPTALFAAEQKRFAHRLRKIGVRFFGFDIDPLPGGGYEDLAEMLDSIPADATIDRIRNALRRLPGETIDQEITRLDEALRLIEAGRLDALRHSATCLRDSFDYVRIMYPAKTFDALNPGMAFRERYMHRQVDRMLGQMRADEKLALMSHNMHLCRAPDAVAGNDAGAGPGGKTDPPLGAWLAARYPGEIFSVWMLIGRGRDSQPFPTLSKEIREKAGTLNALLGEIGDCFVLPIDPSDPRARLLTENIEIMHDGNGGVRTAIARQADAIFFVRDVTPLRA